MTIKFVACTVCSVRSVYVNYVFLGPRYSLGLLQPKRQRVERSHPYTPKIEILHACSTNAPFASSDATHRVDHYDVLRFD